MISEFIEKFPKRYQQFVIKVAPADWEAINPKEFLEFLLELLEFGLVMV
jgi:hypothetical protein